MADFLQQHIRLSRSQFELRADNACTALALDACNAFLSGTDMNAVSMEITLATGSIWWHRHGGCTGGRNYSVQEVLKLKAGCYPALKVCDEYYGPCSIHWESDTQAEAVERRCVSLITALRDMESLACDQLQARVAAVITRGAYSYALLLQPDSGVWLFVDTHCFQTEQPKKGALLLRMNNMSADDVAPLLISQRLGGDQQPQRNAAGDYVVQRYYWATLFVHPNVVIKE